MSFARTAALVWLLSVAPLAAVLIPLMLPAIQQIGGLQAVELGLLASADLIGACIVSLSAPFWIRRVPPSTGALTGLLIGIAANTGTTISLDTILLIPLRLVAGMGTGIVLCCGLPLLAAVKRPERVISAIQLLQLLVGGAALLAGGHILSSYGVPMLLNMTIIVSLISLPVTAILPRSRIVRRIRKGSDRRRMQLADLKPVVPILAGILFFFAALAIANNFAGKLGVQHGLLIATVGSVLALGNLGAIPGSIMAMLSGSKTRQRNMLLSATGVTAITLLVILQNESLWVFAAAFFMIQVCITVIAPLQVAVLVRNDISGRGIEGLAAMQSVGQAIGPLLGSVFITSLRVDGAYIFALILMVVSVGLILIRPRNAQAAMKEQSLS